MPPCPQRPTPVALADFSSSGSSPSTAGLWPLLVPPLCLGARAGALLTRGHLAETEGASGMPAGVAEGRPRVLWKRAAPWSEARLFQLQWRQTWLCPPGTSEPAVRQNSRRGQLPVPPPASSIKPFAISDNQLLSSCSPGSSVCPLGLTSGPFSQSVKVAWAWELKSYPGDPVVATLSEGLPSARAFPCAVHRS